MSDQKSPGRWVNLANIQDTQAAALMCGSSDLADQIVPYQEYVNIERELLELREIRDKFTTAKMKHTAVELKNDEFKYQLTNRNRDFTKLRNQYRRFILITVLFFTLVLIEHVYWVLRGH